jgi:hypothetical protein
MRWRVINIGKLSGGKKLDLVEVPLDYTSQGLH